MSTNHEVIESQSPYQGSFFSVHVDRIRLPNGREATREIVRHPGAAAVVPLKDGAVLLVRQNRHAVAADLLEIPAGKLDVPGEDPLDCARRELKEETGYVAGTFESLGVFYSSPGFTDERFYLYLATDLEQVAPAPDHDGGEPISAEWLRLDAAVDAVTGGRIVDAKTALGLVLTRLKDQR
ncbi:MAG TPA: NUDIX hydrolase [Actinomycetota bacterium]